MWRGGSLAHDLQRDFGVHDCWALVPECFFSPHIGEFALIVPDAAIEAVCIPAGPYLPVLVRRKELLFIGETDGTQDRTPFAGLPRPRAPRRKIHNVRFMDEIYDVASCFVIAMQL